MKAIAQNIRTIIQNTGKKDQLLRQFDLDHVDKLPLVEIESIAETLGLNVQQLLFGGSLRKAFPGNIKLLILDVDGVMTDAGMYYSEKGDMLKKFNAKDGMGILQLTKNDFQVGIISSGFQGEMVKKRADLLKIQHFYLGRAHKIDILNKWCADLNITLSEVAMIGDDVNDLEVMQQIGYSACPSDAANQVLTKADCVLAKKGGEGCIREFIEEVMGIEVQFIS